MIDKLIQVSKVFGQNCEGREEIIFPKVDRMKIYWNPKVHMTIIELADRCFSTYIEPNRIREVLHYDGKVTYCQTCRGRWGKQKPCITNPTVTCTCCNVCREMFRERKEKTCSS